MIKFTTMDAKPEKPIVEVGVEMSGDGVFVYAANQGVRRGRALILYLRPDGTAALCVNAKQLEDLGFQINEAGEIKHG